MVSTRCIHPGILSALALAGADGGIPIKKMVVALGQEHRYRDHQSQGDHQIADLHDAPAQAVKGAQNGFMPGAVDEAACKL